MNGDKWNGMMNETGWKPLYGKMAPILADIISGHLV